MREADPYIYRFTRKVKMAQSHLISFVRAGKETAQIHAFQCTSKRWHLFIARF
jgi:hypothetical protein